jgi:hypothetical protein
MHPVGEIHIRAASFSVHHRISPCFSNVRMAGLILLAIVSFCFYDVPDGF